MKNNSIFKEFLIIFTMIVFCIAATATAAGTEYKPAYWTPSSQLVYYMHQAYGFNKKMISTVGRMLNNNDDVSVALRIARQKNLDPRIVMGMRRKGMTWMQILKSCGMHPSKLYENLSVHQVMGVPDRFKKTFGEYQKWTENPADDIELKDEQVQDLVQLRLVVKIFGVHGRTVMKIRNSGKDWTQIILNRGLK